jgi:Rho termination factor, N-terminal domain
MSLLERMRVGLRELPSNAAWLASRFRGSTDAVGTAAARARDQGVRLSEAVADVVPVGPDSVQLQMKRAQDAADRAREAEERAVEAAQEAKERSDHALRVSERGRARVKEVNSETAREREQRIKQAEKDAEALLKRERLAAQEEAEQRQHAVHAEVEEESERAQQAAETSQRRAEELVEEARERVAEAKRLADETAEAASAAAEQARRHAEQLARASEQPAKEAETQVGLAEELRERSAATARRTAGEGNSPMTNEDLQSYRKSELVEFASTIGIEGRTNMTKDELIQAIRKASRGTRTRGTR